MTEFGRQRQYHRQDLWDKFWKDRHGKVVVFQRPNALLIAWLVLSVASLVAPRGTVEGVLWWASMAALAAWAVLEIWRGVNYFRRGLGALILFVIVLASFRLL